MVRNMADETQLVVNDGEEEHDVNGDVKENGDPQSEIDEELDDTMFDDPEDFIDDISDEGLYTTDNWT